MSYFGDFLDLLLAILQTIFAAALDYAKAHPFQAGLFILAVLRLFGTTVQTGSKGVLFVFGRVRKELEPGFHPLFPLVMTARNTPVRSVTLDLPRQRLTTIDGLVYDVQANIVYRVVDPKLALTQIADLRKGIEAILAIIAGDLIRSVTRAAILDFNALEAELIAQTEQKLGRWGVTVEQAGFKSIAPTKKTLRLTQLAILTGERQLMLQELMAQGVPGITAVALLGADRRLVSHATARYHALQGRAPVAPSAEQAPLPIPLLPGEELSIAQMPTQTEQTPIRESQDGGFNLSAEIAKALVLPRPKKVTKGVQPRSWLRLQRRLKSRQTLYGGDVRVTPSPLATG